MSPNVLVNRARTENWAGNLEAARDAGVRALELSPGMTAQRAALGIVLIRLGRKDEGLAEIAKEQSLGYRLYNGAVAQHLIGAPDEADVLLPRLLELGDSWAFQVANLHALAGRNDEAFRWLERAYDLHDTGIAYSMVSWTLNGLHSDPRWPAFVEKVGLR